jgi:hypothetical protein
MTLSEKQNIGFKLDFMTLTCTFLSKPCDKRDWVYNYDYFYTNCYTWNTGRDSSGSARPLRQINEAGSDRGFRLELFVGSDDYDHTKFDN